MKKGKNFAALYITLIGLIISFVSIPFMWWTPIIIGFILIWVGIAWKIIQPKRGKQE